MVSNKWSTSLDAPAEDFKMASEAKRISLADHFHPLSALNFSDLEPLPHQIQAVYGKLLPEVPLHYLLADDPGAGKTIMAGLYIDDSQWGLVIVDKAHRMSATYSRFGGRLKKLFDFHSGKGFLQ